MRMLPWIIILLVLSVCVSSLNQQTIPGVERRNILYIVLNNITNTYNITNNVSLGGDGNNYTSSIGFSRVGNTLTLNLARVGMGNLTATFDDNATAGSGADGNNYTTGVFSSNTTNNITLILTVLGRDNLTTTFPASVGPKGDTGDTGATGASGTNGTDGVDGVNGTDGVDGVNGSDGVGIVSGSIVAGIINITLTNGSGFVSSNLTGAQGIQGEQGEQGVQGVPGVNGTDGADGADGVNGTWNGLAVTCPAGNYSYYNGTGFECRSDIDTDDQTCAEVSGCVEGAITSYTETDPVFRANLSLLYLASNPLSFLNSTTAGALYQPIGSYGTSNLTIAQVVSSIGNWSADKASYATTAYALSLGNFSAWDKSTGIEITEAQITDLQSYLTSYTETDPVFRANLSLLYLVSNPLNFLNSTTAGALYQPIGSYGTSNLTIAEVVASIGNWTADKASYATTTYALSLGNWSSEQAGIKTNITNSFAYALSLGNWSADKPSYATTTYALSLGNWSSEQAGIKTNITNAINSSTIANYINVTTGANYHAIFINTTTGAAYHTTFLNTSTGTYLNTAFAYALSLGNWSAEQAGIKTNITNAFAYALSLGNWSADKASYATTTYALSLGNWSSEQSGIKTNITNAINSSTIAAYRLQTNYTFPNSVTIANNLSVGENITGVKCIYFSNGGKVGNCG